MARITKSTVAKKIGLPNLSNSTSLSRRRVQRSQATASTPKRQPQKRRSYRNLSTQTNESVLDKTQDLYADLSSRERIDSIVAQLRAAWWSLAAFIEYYVTLPDPSSTSTDTPERRANRLWNAIFKNPKVDEWWL